MKQIQEQQHAQEHEWPSLPANERGNNEAQLNQMGRLARYNTYSQKISDFSNLFYCKLLFFFSFQVS